LHLAVPHQNRARGVGDFQLVEQEIADVNLHRKVDVFRHFDNRHRGGIGGLFGHFFFFGVSSHKFIKVYSVRFQVEIAAYGTAFENIRYEIFQSAVQSNVCFPDDGVEVRKVNLFWGKI